MDNRPDNIITFLQAKRAKEKERDLKYNQDSKDRLEKIIKKKITTTMIGALDAVEKKFSFLWEDENGELQPEQVEFKEMYEDVRQRILDNGNAQIRSLRKELENYNVEWTRYQLKLPVRNLERVENKEDGSQQN
jgi:hypothetical protein